MKKIQTLLVSVMMAMVVSCAKDPIKSSNTNNPNFDVSFLFEHDGIKVYRFYDGGNFVYFTNACGMTKYNTGGETPKDIETHSEE